MISNEILIGKNIVFVTFATHLNEDGVLTTRIYINDHTLLLQLFADLSKNKTYSTVIQLIMQQV